MCQLVFVPSYPQHLPFSLYRHLAGTPTIITDDANYLSSPVPQSNRENVLVVTLAKKHTPGSEK